MGAVARRECRRVGVVIVGEVAAARAAVEYVRAVLLLRQLLHLHCRQATDRSLAVVVRGHGACFARVLMVGAEQDRLYGRAPLAPV